MYVYVWVCGCMGEGVWVYRCIGVWVYGCMVYGCMVYGCMGVWTYGSMGVWEYGSMGVWEHGSMYGVCSGNISFFYVKCNTRRLQYRVVVLII
jgi:hypothetical protein